MLQENTFGKFAQATRRYQPDENTRKVENQGLPPRTPNGQTSHQPLPTIRSEGNLGQNQKNRQNDRRRTAILELPPEIIEINTRQDDHQENNPD